MLCMVMSYMVMSYIVMSFYIIIIATDIDERCWFRVIPGSNQRSEGEKVCVCVCVCMRASVCIIICTCVCIHTYIHDIFNSYTSLHCCRSELGTRYFL